MSDLTADVWYAYRNLVGTVAGKYAPMRQCRIAVSNEAYDQLRPATRMTHFGEPSEPWVYPDHRLTGVEMRAEVRL